MFLRLSYDLIRGINKIEYKLSVGITKILLEFVCFYQFVQWLEYTRMDHSHNNIVDLNLEINQISGISFFQFQQL